MANGPNSRKAASLVLKITIKVLIVDIICMLFEKYTLFKLFAKHKLNYRTDLLLSNIKLNRGLVFSFPSHFELEGRIIKIDYAKPKKKKLLPPPKLAMTFNLFVANLHYEARGHEVVFSQVIFHENPRRLLGYGFMAFKSTKEADATLSACQGKMCIGRSIRVAQGRQFVKLATK
ncbi:hypothetical protein UlMin_006852 [Ulmus minor]